jgi:hypothetical protein
MGLSNYLPNSRISQPGVCTSTTRPASPYEGFVIYETDTDRVLVWNNSAWVDPSTGKSGRSGLVQIVPTVSGTGASVTNNDVVLTNATDPYITCFTSDFSNYRILFDVTAMSNGTAAPWLFRLANGTTPNTTAANYFNSQEERPYTGAFVAVQNNGGTAAWQVGRGQDGTGSIVIDIFNPQSSSRNTYYTSSYSDKAAAGITGGYLSVTTSYDGFNIRLDGTKTFSGTVRVYGYNQ